MTRKKTVFAVQMNPIVGDLEGNTKKILHFLEEGKRMGAKLIVFPEMALTGYPPEDLLLDETFIEKTAHQLKTIAPHTQGITAVIGTVRVNDSHQEKPLFNTAAILQEGILVGFQDKRLLPTYDVFDERRYFEPGKETRLWKTEHFSFAILVCEDMWQHGEFVEETRYQADPVKDLMFLKPDLVIDISSSPYHFQKPDFRVQVCATCARAIQSPMLLVCQVGGNDQLIFDGYSAFVNREGALTHLAQGFKEETLLIDLEEKKKTFSFEYDPIQDLHDALVLGLKDYFLKQGFSKACLGLSGGIDSALVACLAVSALGKDNVIAVSMPSRYTAEQSQKDAKDLSQALGIELQIYSIEAPFSSFLNLLEPAFLGKAVDVTEENMQARIRGLILMALSNKWGYLVLSTGNKSELAMGYCTLYGDMCGGLSVISDVSKTKVYELAHCINRKRKTIPDSILTKAPSAELKFNQKDSDSLPEYALLDKVLEAYIEKRLPLDAIVEDYNLSYAFVKGIVHRIHLAEYKRRQGAPGLRVSSKSFMVGRRYPIVQKWI